MVFPVWYNLSPLAAVYKLDSLSQIQILPQLPHVVVALQKVSKLRNYWALSFKIEKLCHLTDFKQSYSCVVQGERLQTLYRVDGKVWWSVCNPPEDLHISDRHPLEAIVASCPPEIDFSGLWQNWPKISLVLCDQITEWTQKLTFLETWPRVL